MNRNLVVVGLLLLIMGPVWAGGRQDNVVNRAGNAGGFTESVDINERKPGKYNFYIESDDKGGNSTISGPYNIYLDPESDLPVARITNPQADMRAPGNLNIVGTCLDDDGVDHVELVFNDDPETLVIPEGKEFWSYYYETGAFPDGLYSVTAYGVDINGLKGRPHRINWNLDRKSPAIRVESPAAGELVSKTIRIRGQVWDGNGVASLAWSVDGERYIPLNLKRNRADSASTFECTLDTTAFGDGPAIIRFRARDGQGSEGTYTHLVFADNTGPAVTIDWPAEGTAVNGVFQAAGSVRDTVGLKSLSWKLGSRGGELDLVVGNPWWIQEIDLREEKGRAADLEIRAEDLSGNVTVARRRLTLDREGDLPRVTVRSPRAGTTAAETELAVTGFAEDDDGVEAVLWSLDGAEPEALTCTGNFSFTLRDLPAGNHTLTLSARDIYGVAGRPVEIKGLVIAGPAPQAKLEAVMVKPDRRSAALVRPWEPGMILPEGQEVTFRLNIRSENGLREIRPLIGGQEQPVIRPKGRGPEYAQDISLPPEAGTGLIPIYIEIMDSYGRTGFIEEHVRVGGRSGDGDITWVNPRTLEGGRILLNPGEGLRGVLSGVPLVSAEVPGPGLSARVEDGRLIVEGAAEGVYGPVSFSAADAEGRRYQTGAYTFIVDGAEPALAWVGESPHKRWVGNRLELGFQASDANRLDRPQYSLDLGETWTPAGAASAEGIFRETVDLSGLEDGLIEVRVRARDEAGKTGFLYCQVYKDTRAPAARLVVPLPDTPVNGVMRLGLAVEERGSLALVEYLPAGMDERAARILEPSRFVNILMGTADFPLDGGMKFRFTDAAGNRSEFGEWAFTIDQRTDLPVAMINLPREDEVLVTDFAVSGIMYDDDRIARIWYSVDNGEETALEAENAYTIPLSIRELGDNEHTVAVTAEDIYGIRGERVERKFRVSTEEPRAAVELPRFEDISTGTLVITGSASDLNGISRIQVSLDNGASFNNADGAEAWNYTFNTKILQDGTHVVFIRVWDNYGIAGFYSSLVNIDNTAPKVTLESPRDGVTTVGPVFISGQASDEVGLERVTVQVHSVDGNPLPGGVWERELEPGAVVKHGVDLSPLADGIYNIDIRVTDRAKNVTHVSRNVRLQRDSIRNFVDCLYPLEGEHVRGIFNVYGYTGGIDRAGTVTIRVNGIDGETVTVPDTGYFRFGLNGDVLEDGKNTIVIQSDFGGTGVVSSGERTIWYQKTGAWVSIDSLAMGDFAYERPWLSGRAGYSLTEADEAVLADRKADRELRAAAMGKKLKSVELSFDNGKSYVPARSGRNREQDWAWRLETQDMAEGLHYLVVRANMENGETAVSRTLIQIDQTAPAIRLIAPQPGGRYNQSLEYSGLVSDDVDLRETRYALRTGDKAAYEIPGFIQGLYIDTHFLGATLYDLGMGLSFFNDNVKLQIMYGQLTQEEYELFSTGPIRYGGDVLGLKMLANVYALPFNSLLGADWAWLSASVALGANFSLFSVTQSGSPTWMSAILGQFEFPRVTIPKRNYLRTFSFYTEYQLWFVPTDTNAEELGLETVIPHITVGLRFNVF
jgi:hypothetical protein